MTKNKNAFSLVIAILLVLVMTLLVLYILEYMIPYSKNVKGIENSSNAFYQAENSIEDALHKFKTRGENSFTDYSHDFQNNKVSYKYFTTSSGHLIPFNGDGNSEFDTNFNTISQGNPIQLKVGNGVKIDWDNSNTQILFKVPDLGNTEEKLDGDDIINWQLSSDTNKNTLNASGTLIKANEICKGNGTCNDSFGLDSKNGLTIYGSGYTFNEYYEAFCKEIGSGCTLKMSVINELKLNDGTPVPYIEYKFNLISGKNVPLRYSRIESTGKSYGFQKYLKVKVPQQTTNEAFDFTVFQ